MSSQKDFSSLNQCLGSSSFFLKVRHGQREHARVALPLGWQSYQSVAHKLRYPTAESMCFAKSYVIDAPVRVLVESFEFGRWCL